MWTLFGMIGDLQLGEEQEDEEEDASITRTYDCVCFYRTQPQLALIVIVYLLFFFSDREFIDPTRRVRRSYNRLVILLSYTFTLSAVAVLSRLLYSVTLSHSHFQSDATKLQ